MTVEFELDGQSCTVGESGGGSFQPYDTLMAESVPALREAGPSEAEVRRLIEENPRDAFAVRVRPAP